MHSILGKSPFYFIRDVLEAYFSREKLAFFDFRGTWSRDQSSFFKRGFRSLFFLELGKINSYKRSRINYWGTI
ncbi:hypothetical protein A3B18_01630 [Candidatus Giovannonibacteria bacterium RIFCSPLOWO2_01_FULL_46_13]|uniref:Uncharacterized protein n=1 Tax=Candidatus Giovannonibacteria bacterium RIFCSPLOWO2_01_FULL_46_13 TaxID=1798352 RepID=A0A1F5X5W5_9BACT|nr:MAG: hypothetical protein A3B18_01630 [Candidatus Giovannonibacteria bacterium RIFCSPLOWO2_01_FULL_46_13]